MTAGYKLQEFHNAGFTLEELKQLISSVFGTEDAFSMLQELRGAGYSCAEFLRAGYSLSALRGCFTMRELKDAGYQLSEFHAAGYTVVEVQELGPSVRQL